jgi:hypothetical protein
MTSLGKNFNILDNDNIIEIITTDEVKEILIDPKFLRVVEYLKTADINKYPEHLNHILDILTKHPKWKFVLFDIPISEDSFDGYYETLTGKSVYKFLNYYLKDIAKAYPKFITQIDDIFRTNYSELLDTIGKDDFVKEELDDTFKGDDNYLPRELRGLIGEYTGNSCEVVTKGGEKCTEDAVMAKSYYSSSGERVERQNCKKYCRNHCQAAIKKIDEQIETPNFIVIESKVDGKIYKFKYDRWKLKRLIYDNLNNSMDYEPSMMCNFIKLHPVILKFTYNLTNDLKYLKANLNYGDPPLDLEKFNISFEDNNDPIRFINSNWKIKDNTLITELIFDWVEPKPESKEKKYQLIDIPKPPSNGNKKPSKFSYFSGTDEEKSNDTLENIDIERLGIDY